MIFRFPRGQLFMIFIIYQAAATNVDEYEFLLTEAKLLAKYYTPSGESLALIDSAKSAADKNDYELAVIYLEVVITDLYREPDTDTDKLVNDDYKNPEDPKFKIIAGLDFNRHEFEVGYIETDSVILSEINKPFIGLSLDYTIAGTRQHGFGSNMYARADHENMEGRFKLSNPYKKSRMSGYNSLEFNYDDNKKNPDIGYWELAGRQSLNYILPQWFFQIENHFRYKNYKQPSQSVPEFIKNVTDVSVLYEHGLFRNIRLFYQADINESIARQNNDFFEHIAGISFLNWIPGPVSNDFSGNFSYNDFTYALEDSIIKNISTTATGRIQSRTPLFSEFYLHLDYDYRNKIYGIKSEQDPDYREQELETSIQKEFIRNLSIGLGYHYQARENRVSEGGNATYIKEQNYHDNGVLAEINYHNSDNIILTGMITYSKRVYPESKNVDLVSFYKSKNIVNIFILFQTPIYRSLSINVFLSYDGDREFDNDKNDTRSALFSSELEYEF